VTRTVGVCDTDGKAGIVTSLTVRAVALLISLACLVAGVACVKPGTTEPDGPLAARIVNKCIEKGVLMFSPVGFGGGTVKICPPLVITEEALRESLTVFGEAVAEAIA